MPRIRRTDTDGGEEKVATPPYLRQGKDRNWGMRRELPDDLRDAFRIDKKGTKGKAGRNDEDGLARVPEHLRVVICRREVVKTYGKITYEAAKRRHYREIAEVDRLIAEARAWLASQGMEARAEPASHLVTPTLADAKAAILSWFHRQEGRRLARPVPDDPDDREAVLDALRGENAALVGEDGRQRAERVLFGDDPARTGDAVPSTSITRQRADRHGAGILASAGFAAPSGEVRRLAVEIMQQVMAEGGSECLPSVTWRPSVPKMIHRVSSAIFSTVGPSIERTLSRDGFATGCTVTGPVRGTLPPSAWGSRCGGPRSGRCRGAWRFPPCPCHRP